MKVRIETAAAARLFNCDVGAFRDLERPTATPLIDSGDVSEFKAATVPAKRKAARKPAVSSKRAAR
jgi:hypothetical protein